MEKKIKVGEKELVFRATAATPMHYRNVFKGCDLFKDLMKIEEAQSLAKTEAEAFEYIDMGIFERIAYVMSGAHKEGISIETWLEGFGVMDIINALPEIMELWSANIDTQTIQPKNTEAIER